MLVLFSDNICYLIYYTSNQIHCLDFCLTRLLKNLLFKMADVTKNCVIHRTQNCEHEFFISWNIHRLLKFMEYPMIVVGSRFVPHGRTFTSLS